MNGVKICYVYFHTTRFVPIHVYEIVDEIQRRGGEVLVVTCIKDEEAKKKLSDICNTLHNLWTIEIRFVSELLFMAILFPYLLIRTAIAKPDIFYSRHSASTLVVAMIARLFRKSCLIEINDIVVDKLRFLESPKIKLKWIQLYHYLNCRLADYLLPVTDQIGIWLKRQYKINKERVIVIPNGVNIRRFSPKPSSEARKRYQIPLGSRVVLSLGSLFPWAGIETLIAAAPMVLKEFPDTIFAIGSGEEPYLSQLKQKVSQSGLENNFLFFGFIPWDDASWFISIADICVAPFIFKDIRSGVSSLRVLSYLACGKPVVGSDIPGLGDILKKEGIDLSFPMGDHKALSSAISSLLADRAQLKEMSSNNRAFVVENYSWEIIVDKLEILFSALIENSRE